MSNKYYKRSAVIEAINFDDLVQHGIDSGGNIVKGMPWSFKFRGHAITHENDNCYLIASPTGGSLPFKRGDMLTFCGDGSLFPMELAYFCMTYAELPEALPAPPPEMEMKAGIFNKIGTPMFAYGVTRVADSPRAVMVLLRQNPSDDDLRALHEALRPVHGGSLIHPQRECQGMTIKGDGASELGKLMHEQRKGGPVPD